MAGNLDMLEWLNQSNKKKWFKDVIYTGFAITFAFFVAIGIDYYFNGRYSGTGILLFISWFILIIIWFYLIFLNWDDLRLKLTHRSTLEKLGREAELAEAQSKVSIQIREARKPLLEIEQMLEEIISQRFENEFKKIKAELAQDIKNSLTLKDLEGEQIPAIIELLKDSQNKNDLAEVKKKIAEVRKIKAEAMGIEQKAEQEKIKTEESKRVIEQVKREEKMD